MRILAVGGGSGGHVTPIAAVLKVLRDDQPGLELRVWCDRKFSRQARQTMHRVDERMRVDTILAGKLRRYHTMPLWRQLLRLRTIVLPNVRDSALIVAGTVQSFCKLVAWRPDVIFCKGGYVCLPVGVAAHILRIPIVIHDSDAHPGLTNRVLSRWATAIATGAPLEHYSYSPEVARYVGIPVDESFRRYEKSERDAFKKQLGIGLERPLVVVTGGGLGAHTINQAIVDVLDELLETANVILISGTLHYDELRKKTAQYPTDRFQLHAFVAKDMAVMLAAADLVVARAGATTLLELAALAKPTVIVPNPYLTGGHQLKNAEVYAKRKAGTIVDEHLLMADSNELLRAVRALIADPAELKRMGEAIHQFARPDAAKEVAEMIELAAGVRD